MHRRWQIKSPLQDMVKAIRVHQHGGPEYLWLHNLEDATDHETFKSRIPMVTYEDLQPIIERIANGDRSPILSAHPICELLLGKKLLE
ncbi:hypothetical protein L1887_26900 [Cichorium endivia]|nr:hypothetical protein L1887_26900 [Cichorium endivia]